MGTACDELNPPCEPFVGGACCLLDNTCVDSGVLDCLFIRSGDYQGDDSTCATTDCEAPTGACCFAFTLPLSGFTSGCQQASRTTCDGILAGIDALGGTGQALFLGEGTSCEGPDGDR